MANVRRRRHAVDGLFTVLLCLGAAVLLWQGAEYIGLAAWAGEWQFGAADRYWPTLTSAAVVLAVLLLVLLVLAFLRRRRDRKELGLLGPAERMERVLATETRLLRIAVTLAIVGLVGALFCLLTALRLSDAGPLNRVDASRGGIPPEGPAVLEARVDMRHIATLTRNVLLVQQHLFFAPVVDSGGRARYLVELQRVELPRERWIAPRSGLLRRFPAGRELAPLYRQVGITLSDHPYALLRSAETLRWTWKAAAAQSTAFAVIAALFALLFRRRRARLTALMTTDETPPTTST